MRDFVEWAERHGLDPSDPVVVEHFRGQPIVLPVATPEGGDDNDAA